MKIILTAQGFAVEGLKITPTSDDTPFALTLIALLSDAVAADGHERPEIYLGVTGIKPTVRTAEQGPAV